MRGRVKEVKPNASKSQIDGFINRRIRNVIDKRSWADGLRLGSIAIPDAFTTGTISFAPGSNQVAGAGTGWPTNDMVNTSLNNPIKELGFNENIAPVSMANIAVGQFVIIEAENPDNTEITAVTAVGVDQFTAYVRKKHDAGVTVIVSSLTGLQLRTNNYVWTVQGVLSPTSLQVDQKWAGAALTAQAYQIVLEYAQITCVTKRAMFCWDPVAGQSIGTQKALETAVFYDPQDSCTGDPQELISMPPGTAGVMQFKIWPVQFSARLLSVVTSERWPMLKYDTDLSPHYLNPEIFIAGACADALRSKVIPREGKSDPLYDLEASGYWEGEYARLLEEAEQADEGRYLRAIQNYEQQAMRSSVNYNWMRSHAVSADGWGY